MNGRVPNARPSPPLQFDNIMTDKDVNAVAQFVRDILMIMISISPLSDLGSVFNNLLKK